MEGFLHHMAPQFLHPALQSFGCGAFRPIGGAFHPLYPGKAFARHLGEQYALGQSVGQALRVSFKLSTTSLVCVRYWDKYQEAISLSHTSFNNYPVCLVVANTTAKFEFLGSIPWITKESLDHKVVLLHRVLCHRPLYAKFRRENMTLLLVINPSLAQLQ